MFIDWQHQMLYEMSKDTCEEAFAALERYLEEMKTRETQETAMNEFEKLVKEMRSMQKAYFRTREAQTLNASKRLEKEVDKYLADKENPQMELFGGGNENLQ